MADKALTRKKKTTIVLHQRNSFPKNVSILITLLKAYHRMFRTLINLHISGTRQQTFLLKSSER